MYSLPPLIHAAAWAAGARRKLTKNAKTCMLPCATCRDEEYMRGHKEPRTHIYTVFCSQWIPLPGLSDS